MQAATLTDMPPPSHREKDEIDEMKMAPSDLEKKRSFRSRSSAKPPSHEAKATAGDGPVGLGMIQVNPMHDQL